MNLPNGNVIEGIFDLNDHNDDIVGRFNGEYDKEPKYWKNNDIIVEKTDWKTELKKPTFC